MAAIWNDDDYRALVQAAAQVNARPMDLLLVLTAESGLNPQAIAKVDGKPYARGLNQITPVNANGMKLSTEEWESISDMTPRENLPYVVKSLRSAVGSIQFRDAGMLYQVNFAPATLKKGSADDLVLYAMPSGGYMNNRVFDKTNKGYITVGDLRKHLEMVSQGSTFRTHAARLAAVVPGLEGPVIGLEEGGNTALFWTLMAGAAVAGGVYAYQKGYLKPERVRENWLELKGKATALKSKLTFSQPPFMQPSMAAAELEAPKVEAADGAQLKAVVL